MFGITRYWRCWWYRWALLGKFLVVGGAIAFSGNCAFAQSNIVRDNTLGAESSVVTPNVNINGIPSERIDGGAIRSANLFHSFQEFNIEQGRGAYFTNPTGIENILSRVTGGNRSEIFGKLGVLGNANLFLINPSGIIFGQNASLDVRGSFVASTASSLNFADGIKFSATTPETTPLLTITVPLGLQFGGNAGRILNQSQATNSRGERVGLQVQSGKTLALVGGEVMLSGGYLTAAGRQTEGGRIELGSVADNSLVRLNPTDKGWLLGYEGIQNFQDIKLSQNAVVDASGSGGGDIYVQGRRVTITDGSQMVDKTLGAGSGGTFSINASLEVVVSGESVKPLNEDVSRLTTRTEGSGTAGNLTITTPKFIVQDGAQVTTGSVRQGSGGILNINASDLVEVSGASADGSVLSRLTTRTDSSGSAGNLIITTDKLVIRDGGQVSSNSLFASRGSAGSINIKASDSVKVTGESFLGKHSSRLTTQTAGTKDAGDLTITTPKLIIEAGGQVSAGTTQRESTGSGGTLNINASNFVEVSGASATRKEFSRLTTRTEGDGAAGDLTITTGKLIIRDGGQVSSGTDEGSTGSGGSLTVNASDSVEVSGFIIMPNTNSKLILSRLTTRTEGDGAADNLTINTSKLIIQNGGQVSAGTVDGSKGNGGNLTVNASDFVQVIGTVVNRRGNAVSSRLTNRTENDKSTGNLKITTGELIIQDGAEVGVNSIVGSGEAGNLKVAARSIRLDNGATLNARAASVDGGDITLQIKDLLLLRRNSQISATAGIEGGSGDGGNITINAPDAFIVAVPNENSDIAANAFTGSGGRVEITAEGIFGLTPRSREELQTLLGTKDPDKLNPARLPSSEITAISRTNPSLSGQVSINTPDVDPNRGLVNLPTVPLDTEVSQICQPRTAENQSSFTIIGRGGLPPNPRTELLTPDAVQVDWVTLKPRGENRVSTNVLKATSPTLAPIVEAQGWVRNAKGEVVLTADGPTATPHSSWLAAASCP